MNIQTLKISAVTVDERCQPRSELNPEIIGEYAGAMEAGAAFPPLTVFHDEGSYWLADGFHRLEAARAISRDSIPCEIRVGGLREAILHSVGANATHGLRRSNLYKRRAVESLLGDEEWRAWSDREIARRCGVSQPFVGSIRKGLSDNGYQIERTVQRGDSVYTMRTKLAGKEFPFEIMPPMTVEEYAGLKLSISRFGVIAPVHVDQNGMVIDGNHRVKAWNELRAEGLDVPDYARMVRWFNDDDERIEHAIVVNCLRKQYTDAEKVLIGMELECAGLLEVLASFDEVPLWRREGYSYQFVDDAVI